MPPKYVYVRRNPIHPYTYNNPDDLPYIQWKRVKISTAYTMYTSKQKGWERAKTTDYINWQKQMVAAGHKIL